MEKRAKIMNYFVILQSLCRKNDQQPANGSALTCVSRDAIR